MTSQRAAGSLAIALLGWWLATAVGLAGPVEGNVGLPPEAPDTVGDDVMREATAVPGEPDPARAELLVTRGPTSDTPATSALPPETAAALAPAGPPPSEEAWQSLLWVKQLVGSVVDTVTGSLRQATGISPALFDSVGNGCLRAVGLGDADVRQRVGDLLQGVERPKLDLSELPRRPAVDLTTSARPGRTESGLIPTDMSPAADETTTMSPVVAVITGIVLVVALVLGALMQRG
ncbi:MAG: hypothetical protein BWZ02_03008 [Lentisphaerae bacterium ADurb.BinA184]|nr:MAG: hypothetical protein BWZ02_03008 [Lentisphaerae bacterium ADurb.BinA184]